MEISSTFNSAPLGLIALICLPAMYVYLIIFAIRDEVIEKLNNLYTLRGLSFVGYGGITQQGWDSLNYGKFVIKYPIIWATIRWIFVILVVPFFIAMFGILIFGNVPVKTELDPNINITIFKEIVLGCYLLAILGNFFHFLKFKKYKKIASGKIWRPTSAPKYPRCYV